MKCSDELPSDFWGLWYTPASLESTLTWIPAHRSVIVVLFFYKTLDTYRSCFSIFNTLMASMRESNFFLPCRANLIANDIISEYWWMNLVIKCWTYYCVIWIAVCLSSHVYPFWENWRSYLLHWFGNNFRNSTLSCLGCMTVLPTILFLITRVLKETAVKSADNQVPPPVSAALQGIKTIVTLPTVKTDETQNQWASLIRSTLASVLEYSQPGKWFPSAENLKQNSLLL